MDHQDLLDELDQTAGTLEVLNSFNGQIALQRPVIGESEAGMGTNLKPNHYRISIAHHLADLAGAPGHLGRNSKLRVSKGAAIPLFSRPMALSRSSRVLAGLMQIQTGYPSVKS